MGVSGNLWILVKDVKTLVVYDVLKSYKNVIITVYPKTDKCLKSLVS